MEESADPWVEALRQAVKLYGKERAYQAYYKMMINAERKPKTVVLRRRRVPGYGRALVHRQPWWLPIKMTVEQIWYVILLWVIALVQSWKRGSK